MVKTVITDLYTHRIKDDEMLPDDHYNVEHVAETYDGKAVLMISGGKHHGKTFIAGRVLGQESSTLH